VLAGQDDPGDVAHRHAVPLADREHGIDRRVDLAAARVGLAGDLVDLAAAIA
jgi:hypothetical protein